MVSRVFIVTPPMREWTLLELCRWERSECSTFLLSLCLRFLSSFAFSLLPRHHCFHLQRKFVATLMRAGHYWLWQVARRSSNQQSINRQHARNYMIIPAYIDKST